MHVDVEVKKKAKTPQSVENTLELIKRRCMKVKERLADD